MRRNTRHARTWLSVVGVIALLCAGALAARFAHRGSRQATAPPALSAATVAPSGPSVPTSRLRSPRVVAGQGARRRADHDEDEHEPGTDSPYAALQFRLLQQQDENGHIPQDGMIRAKEHVDLMRSSGAVYDAAGISPSSWRWLGPGNIGGRVRSIVVHPALPSTWYAGSVSGGIWKTVDSGAHWAPVDDFLATLSVSTMVMQPDNPLVMYAGTGESVQGLQGAGIFKSTDGGDTWARLVSTATDEAYHYVNRLAMSSNGTVLLAATWRGIYRSIDDGATFSLVLNTFYNPSYDNPMYVSFSPADNSRAIASSMFGGAWYSTNGGLTWTAATGLPANPSVGRVELAYAPGNPAIVYASVDQSGGTIYKSTNGGVTYSFVSSGTNYFSPPPQSQGWYDNALWVDPTNPNTLIVGGIDLWRSTDGGATLTQISTWWMAPQSAHADQHVIVGLPGFNGSTNKAVVFGNDGGIYYTADVYTVGNNPQNTNGWISKNNNLGVTQFYGAAGNAATGTIVGGTQDNGTLRYTPARGSEAYTPMAGGDGGYAASDPADPNFFFGEYPWLNIHRSSNGGASSNADLPGIPDANGNSNFIAPFILDPNNPNTLLAGGASLWRTGDAKFGNPPGFFAIKAPATSFISAIAIAPGDSDICWVGHNNGEVYKSDDCATPRTTWTQVDNNSVALPNRMVMRLTIDPSDPSGNRVYATFGGFSADNVWRTTNGGASWSSVGGSGATALPAVPVHDLEIFPGNVNWLYAATEIGVFTSQDAGVTWHVPPDGPANVIVSELFWMGSDLVAATFGRGIYKVTIDDPIQLPPTVVTSAATNVTTAAATLNGTVNPNGSSTTALFDYGVTASYGAQAAASPAPGSGTSPVAVSAAITGLTCNTSYHVRAVATNAAGPAVGNDVQFTTPACPAPTEVLDGFNAGANDGVFALEVQPDGKILVGGRFTTLGTGGTGTATRNRIGRLNADGSLDTGFNPGANGQVSALAVQADGKILIGGNFTTLGGGGAGAAPRNYIGRLNADGSLDADFNPGANAQVLEVTVQPDGKILVGGDFTTLGGGGTGTTARNHIGRLNADGSLDATFNPGANDQVIEVVLQPDGKILVSGDFTMLGGGTGTTARNYIGRLNADGSLDTSFNPGAYYAVRAVAVQPDGKIVVGGIFSLLGGGIGTTPRSSIGRLNADGTLDAGFNPGANIQVRVFAVQPDGKIVVAGRFTTLGGGGSGTTPRNRLGRLNADGSLDTTFNPGANDFLFAMALQSDGRILVGGVFTMLGGGGTGTTPRNRLGRLNADGSLDADLNPGANAEVYAVALQPDGKLVVGGLFSALGGGGTGTTQRSSIGRFNVDGSLDAGFNPGADFEVTTVAVQPDGKIVVGGFFTRLGGGGTGTTGRNFIGRLNADGSLDTSFDPNADGVVLALALQPDGKILVGGYFSTLGGGWRNSIARLNADGSLDSGFDPGANATVVTLAVQPDGKILVGGRFTMLGGGGTGTTMRQHIGRLNADGSLDASFDPGANGDVIALAVQADGKILAGGDFSGLGRGGVDTTIRNSIGRFNADGSLDASFDPGANSSIRALAVQADGRILVGGVFTTLGGGGFGTTTRNRIGRLNADGSLDSSFDAGADNRVSALALQPDGKILAGGAFTTLGGGGTGTRTRSYLGRLANTDAAMQNLRVTGDSVVTWSRSGGGPEVERVTFESSTDGATYASLGSGRHVAGGWQLISLSAGQSLAADQNLYIRARGYYSTGLSNASGSIAESIRKATVSVPAIHWATPAPIVYGTALGATQLNATGSVPGTFVYEPASGTVLAAGSGHTLSVTFTPTDTANYTSATTSVTIDVLKATPTLTWTTPADIVFGTALGVAQLNATATVPGTFAYTPDLGAILSAGAGQTLSVTFTPADAANYTTATTNVSINVLKATPTLTWMTPADIVFGTALGAAQLNATATVPGTFAYTPDLGAVLSAGAGQTLHVTFTPSDAGNYSAAGASVSINVLQATPAITWPAPADIAYGTALGATQLNATASLPGVFTYTPSAGTVLAAGVHTLSVTFAPADSNYTIATATVELTVTLSTAIMIYPADGTIDADLSLPIRWTTVPHAQAYWLYVGSTVGLSDLVDTGEMHETSRLVSFPGGRTAYARLWTKVGGVWRYSDSSFSTASASPLTATLTYPLNGATNADLTRPLQWTTVANAQAYWLYVGSTIGFSDLVNTGEILETSRLVILPGGQTVYVRLWTRIGGVWRYSDAAFTTRPDPP